METQPTISGFCGSQCSCALKQLNGQRAAFVDRGRFFELPRKTVVYEQGDRFSGIYLVCGGQLKLARRTQTGQGQMIALVGAGDVLGIEQLPHPDRYDHGAQALARCRLFHLPAADAEAALAHPAFARAILRSVLRALNSRHHHLHHVLGRGVRARLLHSLRHWAMRFGRHKEQEIELDLALVNEDWADWVGSTPQTVSAEFSKLQRQGCLTRRARKIVLKREWVLNPF